jgi:hypothetical protein
VKTARTQEMEMDVEPHENSPRRKYEMGGRLSVFRRFHFIFRSFVCEKISCLSLTVIQSNDIFSQIEQHYGEGVAVEV